MRKNFWDQSILLLALLPVFAYFYTSYHYSSNIPFYDDYTFFNEFMLLVNEDSIYKKFKLFFSQHNEHRLAFNRLTFFLFYIVFNEIDFKLMPLIGNTALLVLLLIFWKNFYIPKKNWYLFVPVIFFLFQLQNWENMSWGVACLSNYYVHCFAGVTFYLMKKNSRISFLLSIIFATLAAYTQGSGLAVFVCVLVYFFVNKRVLRSFFWMGVTIFVFFLYFLDYQKPWHHPSILNSIIQPDLLLKYFFTFLGSSVSFDNKIIAFISGFWGFICYVFLVRKKYYYKNPFIFFFTLFIVVAGIMATLTRSGFGVDQALTSRYKINSILFIILIYFSYVELFYKSKKYQRVFLMTFFLTGLVIYGVSFNRGVINLVHHKDRLSRGLITWLNENKGLSFPDNVRANAVLIKAMQSGFYNIPVNDMFISDDILSKSVDINLNCQNKNSINLKADFNIFKTQMHLKKDGLLRIEGIRFFQLQSKFNLKQDVYILLKSRKNRYAFLAHPPDSPKDSIYFKKGFQNLGFVALISSKFLASGVYEIGLCQGKVSRYFNTFFVMKDYL